MPRNLGVNEAAAAIRGKFLADRSFRGDPEAAHGIKFAKEVAKALDAGDDPADVMHIVQLLREEGITLHAGHEYPKYVTRKWDHTSHIAQDEQDADRIIDEPAPEAFAPAPRVVDQPVQDLSLDLQDKVPHTTAADHPAGWVPSSVTNREAAQDAYARQPVEGQDRALAKDAYLGQQADDDEVHIEELAATSRDESAAPYAKPAGVGVMAHDDPDRDGFAGQDANPTHDSVLGTQEPQHTGSHPAADNLRGDDEPGMAAQRVSDPATRRPVGTRRPE